MRIIARVVCGLLLGSAFGAHADYAWELAGLFDHTERDSEHRIQDNDELDSDLFSMSATYHFSPVEEGNGPAALAAFLEPRTQLSVAAGEERITSQFMSGPNSFANTLTKREVGDYSLRGVYLFPKSKWYAGGRYTRRDGEARYDFSSTSTTGSGDSSDDVEDYALLAGKYFGRGSATRLELSVEQSTVETDSSSTTCIKFTGTCSTRPFSGKSTSDTPRLAVMHVGGLRSATYAVIGDISEERARDAGPNFEPPRTYFVGAELYPVPAIGVRLGYESFQSRPFDQDIVSVGASWFFRPNVGIDLTLSREGSQDNNPFSDDDPRYTDDAALRVIGRF